MTPHLGTFALYLCLRAYSAQGSMMSLCKPSAVNAMPTRSSAYSNARIPLAREPSMLCPACNSCSNAFSKMAYNVGDNGSPCATPWSMGKKSDFCPLTTTRLLLPWYRFLMMRHSLPLTPMSHSLCKQTIPPYSIKGLSRIPEKQPRRKTLPSALLNNVGQAIHMINTAALAPEASLAHMQPVMGVQPCRQAGVYNLSVQLTHHIQQA